MNIPPTTKPSGGQCGVRTRSDVRGDSGLGRYVRVWGPTGGECEE